MVRAPDRPSRAAFQLLGRSPPSGVVAPSPVTTTRRGVPLAMSCSSSFRSGPCRTSCCLLPRGGPGWPVARPPRPGGSALRALDVRDGVADGLEVLHVVVGDPHAELLL